MKEHRINNITDLLKYSEEDFEKMLPDLILWHKQGRAIQAKCNVRVKSFIWVNDNKQGNLLGIRVSNA
jgi:hypothetical protein